jgi:hypothetical protein
VKKLLTAPAAPHEVLGDHQDARVAEQRILGAPDGLSELLAAEVVFVGGRLVERERARRVPAQPVVVGVGTRRAHITVL